MSLARMKPGHLSVSSVKSLDERIVIMSALVRDSVRGTGRDGFTPEDAATLRHLAVSMVATCPDRDEGCEIAKVFWFVKGNVRYTHDIHNIDTYQSAARTLQFQGGDCDDHAILLCTLLSELGFQVGFRVISTSGKSWEHVYAIVGVPKRAPTAVIPLDTTVPSAYPGWEPAKRRIKAVKDFYPLDLTT